MGTRHLIAVQLNGEYKVAQYGQWDGYPSSTGVEVLSFLRDADLPAFTERVRSAHYVPHEELTALGDRWLKVYPHQSRDVGADILSVIAKSEPGIGLRNSIEFAADSLMCEYAYVIDLDKQKLEVFKGFNTEPLEAGERFAAVPLPKDGGEYHQVRKIAEFDLGSLPSDAEFVQITEPQEEAA